MKFDVYSNYTTEIKTDDNTTSEKSTRKGFKNVSLDDAKKLTEDILKNIPENTTYFYLSVEKSYEQKLDAALNSI